MDDFLFVYGTLRSEFENPHALRLRAGAQLIGPATVRGAIFKVADYPGYRPTPEGEVRGELYRIANPAALLKTLDAYEGSEYVRVLLPVLEINVPVWIYQYRTQPDAETRIESGDFCKP